MATKAVLTRACEQYAAQNRVAIQVESVGGVDAANRIRAGETADIVLLASNSIDQLILEGFLNNTIGRIDWVKSGIGIAMPTAQAVPPMQSIDDVKQAVRDVASLSYSTGPSGIYLEKLFNQWGLTEQVKTKMVLAPVGVPVARLVAQGQAQLGFQQLSELLGQPGIQVLGPLPAQIQLITTFSAGVHRDAMHYAGALELLRYLTNTQLHGLIRQHGMDPA
jgi:molybdate transport system substrate-binding protein